MLGSSDSISGANIVLNTAVAESLRQYADILEQADDFGAALHTLIQETIRRHKRIIFNGNGYDDQWVAEAERRGLLNLKTTPDCLPYFVKPKNIRLFTEHRVFTEAEIRARYEILLENYSKVLNIEALTMLDMANKDLLPAYSAFTRQLGDTIAAKKAAAPGVDCTYEEERLRQISGLIGGMYRKTRALEEVLLELVHQDIGELERAQYYRTRVFGAMNELRIAADEIESVTDRKFYPYPNYGDLLFGVR